MFSHVVSDHWTGEPKPALSDATVEEVSVNVEEVAVFPSTSAVLSEPGDSSDPPDDGQADRPEQDDQSDEADAVEEGAFGSTQTFALRWVLNHQIPRKSNKAGFLSKLKNLKRVQLKKLFCLDLRDF